MSDKSNHYEMSNLDFDMHKRKCEELRKVRVEMAKMLGVPHVVRDEPCNYMGECEGTCPACYMEEKALMDRIYELSKSGVEFTLKKEEAEPKFIPSFAPISSGPDSAPTPPIPPTSPIPPRPPVVLGGVRPAQPIPPVEPKMPVGPRPPVIQGGVRPRTYEEEFGTTDFVPEKEPKKRGIFDRIKKKK